MVTLGTFVPAPHLCFLALQSISFCDLCHWQQRTACSHVQTLLAACDSAPQAVNCSCGCPYCFYEKFFSLTQRESISAPERQAGAFVCADCLRRCVHTGVGFKSARTHAAWTLGDNKTKKKKKLLLKKEDWSRECCYWSFWKLFFFLKFAVSWKKTPLVNASIQ